MSTTDKTCLELEDRLTWYMWPLMTQPSQTEKRTVVAVSALRRKSMNLNLTYRTILCKLCTRTNWCHLSQERNFCFPQGREVFCCNNLKNSYHHHFQKVEKKRFYKTIYSFKHVNAQTFVHHNSRSHPIKKVRDMLDV